VVLIATLLTAIVAGPYIVKYMKRSPQQDYSGETEDPVDEFVQLVRQQEWSSSSSDVEGGDEESSQRQNVMEVLLKDVVKSQALQQAAQEFVVQTVNSEEFQTALKRLVRTLWNDLVTDPETKAQVVHLLQHAIRSPDVQQAVQELVVRLFVDEPEVQAAMTAALQRLGEDERVRQAAVQLLTAAAHTTLNDPDVLDHSMEFASDVVADDLIQRTAGEALRNTISHAMQPGSQALMLVAGVGLLLVSFLSLGYSGFSVSRTLDVAWEGATRFAGGLVGSVSDKLVIPVFSALRAVVIALLSILGRQHQPKSSEQNGEIGGTSSFNAAFVGATARVVELLEALAHSIVAFSQLAWKGVVPLGSALQGLWAKKTGDA
jgi:uncharacterized membrane-anchored protein YjiN (DUF445 family)